MRCNSCICCASVYLEVERREFKSEDKFAELLTKDDDDGDGGFFSLSLEKRVYMYGARDKLASRAELLNVFFLLLVFRLRIFELLISL